MAKLDAMTLNRKTFRHTAFVAAMTSSLLLGAALFPAYGAEQITGTPGSSGAIATKPRSHLPMPNTMRPTLTTYDAKNPDSKFPPIEQLLENFVPFVPV